jgi:Ca-activated chloride channel family protein
MMSFEVGKACSRKMQLFRFALLAAAVVCAVLFAGCAKKMKAPAISSPGGDLRYSGSLKYERIHSSIPSQSRQALSGSLPSLDVEIWVIARSEAATAGKDEDSPGCGAMVVKSEAGKEIPLPLKHTDVKANVFGYIATVSVTQQFHNPFDTKIEATYVFPLPQNAAINEFIMTIGERRIRGIIRERQEAEQVYQEAKRQGYVASLLTQERPNVFTQSVANIEPDKEIDVQLTYFNTLAWVDGWYEFAFPMVVGPRFNPPGSTNGIGAVARGDRGISGQSTEVQYLKPGERSGHDIALSLEVNAGVAIEETECRSHIVSEKHPQPELLVVTLSPNDRIPNKDFVFRYRVAGDQIKSGLLISHDERGGYFTLMLFPPKNLAHLNRKPLEMVFVLDCSGSMSGRPIEQAKLAVDRALRYLKPGDTFQLIRFSNEASQLGPKPVKATPENIRSGLDYLASLNGQGGTMMINGIKAALDFPHDPGRLRFVCFLTDGYIGNETEILAETRKRLGSSRIFSFGVGSSVNRYLLEHLAKLGSGAVAFLGPNDSPANVMDAFVERIAHPALMDLKFEWGGMDVSEVFPTRTPDLFVGRPVVLTGRFKNTAVRSMGISGQAGGKTISWRVPAFANSAPSTSKSLPSVWARMKIADLSDHELLDTSGELAGEIKQVALDFGLISAYTAFIAVDASRVTKGNQGTTVPVAVPVPDGVKYETTVQEK